MIVMKTLKLFISIGVASAVLFSGNALAWSANKVDREVNETIKVFQEEVNGADLFLNQAAGYIVFPHVIKVGIGVGAETGEGELRVGGKTVGY